MKKSTNPLTSSEAGCRSGKITFFNRKAAKKRAKHFASRFGGTNRVYACPLCGLFHVTTTALRERRR